MGPKFRVGWTKDLFKKKAARDFVSYCVPVTPRDILFGFIPVIIMRIV